MKYIKKIFESESLNVDELKDVFEAYFSFLLDDGFIIKVSTERGSLPENHAIISLTKGGVEFEWDEVKDSFIPFIKYINKEYNILDCDIFWKRPTDAKIRFRYPEFISGNKQINYKDFLYNQVIDDRIFSQEGYWKNKKFYKWNTDPKLISIHFYIKLK
jgi:hypothetical protein